jgi:ribose/xylose/arabinose/galactoside ABC-type transport system permease subunit
MALTDQTPGQSTRQSTGQTTDTALVAAGDDEPAFRGVGLDPEPRRQRLAAWLLRNGIVVALAVELVFFWSQSEKFLTASNVELVLIQGASVAVIAAPVGLLLLSGYIDFAVGSTAGLAGAFMGLYLDSEGGNPVVGVLIAVGVGAAVGAVQGGLATKLTLSPIIITLGFYTAVRGLVFVVSDGDITNKFGDSFRKIGRANFPGTGIAMPVFIAAGALLLAWVFHTRTKWGRHVVSIGVNAEAARRAGISAYRLPFILYIATGASAGLAATILASRLDSAPPTLAEGLEIEVLSAVLLGGVAFGGGKGSIVGVAAGVAFIGFLKSGLLMVGATPFWVRLSSGLALVAAATLEGTSRYLERRRRGATT